MTSGEGETVDFTNKVDVMKPGNAGAVECWLVEVEESMMDILREVTDKSNKAYPTADRVKPLGFQSSSTVPHCPHSKPPLELPGGAANGLARLSWQRCLAFIGGTLTKGHVLCVRSVKILSGYDLLDIRSHRCFEEGGDCRV